MHGKQSRFNKWRGHRKPWYTRYCLFVLTFRARKSMQIRDMTDGWPYQRDRDSHPKRYEPSKQSLQTR